MSVKTDVPGILGNVSYAIAIDPADGTPIGTASKPLITSTGAPQTTSGMTAVVIDTAAIGDTTVATATAAQTTRVHRMRLNVAGATTITIKSGTTTLEKLKFPGAGFLTYDFATRPWYITVANQALVLSNSAAVQVDGVVEFIKG